MGGILPCGCLVLNWMLLKRGTGNGEQEVGTWIRERGRGTRERVTGTGNGKRGTGNGERGEGKRPHPNFALCLCTKLDATINSLEHKQ